MILHVIARSLLSGAVDGAMLVVLALSAPLSSAWAQSSLPVPKYDEKEWREVGVSPPAYPSPNALVRFPTDWTTSQVWIDSQTLSIGADQVVRYTLVIRSAGGAENVTFEGLRCETGERRLYGFGRRDGSWGLSRNADWLSINDSSSNRHYFQLWRDVFCDGKVTESRDRILRHLARGGRERAAFTPSD